MHNFKKGRWIQNYDKPSDEKIIEALDENAMSLRYVKSPSDSIIEYAINKNPFSIQYIQNPSIGQQMKALSRNVAAIQVIDKPSNEIIDYANQIDPRKMEGYEKNETGNFLKIHKNEKNNYSIDLKKENEKKFILNKIRTIENPSYEMQFKAIQDDYSALQIIKKIHPKVYKELYFDKNFDVYSLDFRTFASKDGQFNRNSSKKIKRPNYSQNACLSNSWTCF